MVKWRTEKWLESDYSSVPSETLKFVEQVASAVRQAERSENPVLERELAVIRKELGKRERLKALGL